MNLEILLRFGEKAITRDYFRNSTLLGMDYLIRFRALSNMVEAALSGQYCHYITDDDDDLKWLGCVIGGS